MICVYFNGNRIVSNWNSLPDYVITSNSVGIFENRLNFEEIKHVIFQDRQLRDRQLRVGHAG